MIKTKSIQVMLSFLLLAGCTITPNAQPTANLYQNIETISPQLTATPTTTETPFPTPTSIPFPIPSQIAGGEFIAFEAFNYLEDEFYCGIMDMNGDILFKMTGDESSGYGRFFCGRYSFAEGFSPDGKLFAYFPLNDFNLQIINFTTGNTQSYDLSQFASDKNCVKILSEPNVFWVDKNRLFFLDKNTDNLMLLNTEDRSTDNLGVFPSDTSPCYVHEMDSSPDGNYILIHSKENEQPALYLIDLANNAPKNVISGLGYTQIYRNEWSPDSTRFAFFARDTEKKTLIIMKSDGSLINSLEIKDRTTVVFWSPDGTKLAYPCNDEKGLCIADKDGNNLQSITTDGYPGEIAWSPDSKKIVFAGNHLKQTSLYHLEDGKVVLLHEANATNSGSMRQNIKYDWSADSNWVLIAESGRTYDKKYFSKEPLYTPVLCDLDGICRDYYLEEFNMAIQQTAWIDPKVMQMELNKYLPTTNIVEGEKIFSDNLTGLSDTEWNVQGSIGQGTSDFGTFTSITGKNGPAKIERNSTIGVGDGVLIDFQIPYQGAKFTCGLISDRPNPQKVIGFGNKQLLSYVGTTFYYYKWIVSEENYREPNYFTIPTEPITNWLTLFLRVRENNQIEIALYDNGKMVKGVDLITDASWDGERFKFYCETEQGGSINLHGYKELSFPQSQSTWNATTLTPSIPTITPFPGISWEFNWNDFSEGWEAWNQVDSVQIQDGYYEAVSTGDDPYIGSPNFIIDASKHEHISINMKVSSGDLAQLFFITTQDQIYNENKSITFTITGDDQFHIYDLDMSTVPGWSGSIYQIRLDPDPNPVKFAIDYIRIE